MNEGGEYKRAPEEERMELDREMVMVPGVIGVNNSSKRVDVFWFSAVICALSIWMLFYYIQVLKQNPLHSNPLQ